VTASNATVKSWTADQLKLEAQGDGLMFTRTSRALTASSSTLSNAAHAAMAANAAAAAAPAGAVMQPPLPPQLQQHYSGYSGLSGTDTEFSHDGMGSGGSGGGSGSTRSGPGGPVSGGVDSLGRAAGGIDSGGRDSGSYGSMPMRGISSRGSSTATAFGQQPGSSANASPLAATGNDSTSSSRLGSGRYVAPSAAKPNPFSRAAVEARGMVVGANNRVLPAALRGLPEHQAIALQQAVAPVMQMLTAAAPQVGPAAAQGFCFIAVQRNLHTV